MNKDNPNLSEWRKQNPGMSINDYFKIFGTSSPTSNENSYFLKHERARIQKELNQKKTNQSSWPYVFFALFILIAFLSNPKVEDHRAALKIKLTRIVEIELSKKTDNIILFGLGKSLIDSIMDEGLKNISSDNYLFFSVTKFNYTSKSKIIGFGVLGKVFISEKINKDIFTTLAHKFNN